MSRVYQPTQHPSYYQNLNQQYQLYSDQKNQEQYIHQNHPVQPIAPYGEHSQIIQQTPLNQSVAQSSNLPPHYIKNLQQPYSYSPISQKRYEELLNNQSQQQQYQPQFQTFSPSRSQIVYQQQPINQQIPQNQTQVKDFQNSARSFYAPPTFSAQKEEVREYQYPTITHNIANRSALSTTAGFRPGENIKDYIPKTVYKYGPDFIPSSTGYFDTAQKNRNLNPVNQQEEIPTATMTRKVDDKEPLDEHFKAYKNTLHQNIYTYMQMVDNVVLCLKEQTLCDREIETLKRQLWERKDFEVRKLFNKFTRDDKFLTLPDFCEGISGFLCLDDVKRSDAELLLQRYARGYADKKKITYEEFRTIFSISTIPPNRKGKEQEELSSISINIASRLIKMLLNSESSMEYVRQKLKKKLCNFTYVYDYIDRKHRGMLTESDFRCLIENTGENFFVNQKDTEKLMKRFDRNQDNIVDLTEFILEFQPKSKAVYIEDEY